MLIGSSPSRSPPKRRKRGDDGYRRSNPFVAIEASEDEGDEEEGDEEDEDMEDRETEGGLSMAVGHSE